MPSLARSVPKEIMGEAGEQQPVGTSLFQSSLSTSYLAGCEEKVKSKKVKKCRKKSEKVNESDAFLDLYFCRKLYMLQGVH